MYDGPSSLELTPKQFELEVKNIIMASGEALTSFSAQHLEKLKGHDGEYEIDVTARFAALGGSFLVLIECKRYSSPVKREIVQALNDKIRSLGAQKGMIFTTSGFQSGAIAYAKQHRIALVQLVDGKTVYHTRSAYGPSVPPPWAKIPPVVGWLVGHAENGNVTTSQISSDRPDYLKEFLFGEKS